MGRAAEWLLPLGAGVLAMLAAAWLLPGHPGTPGQDPASTPTPSASTPVQAARVTWPFLEGPRVADADDLGRVQLLVLDPRGPPRPALLDGGEEVAVAWPTTGVGLTRPTRLEAGCGTRGPTPPLVAALACPGEPRFGRNGTWSLRATIFLARTDGRLLAASETERNLTRFALDGDFQRLPDLAWYLGNGTRPAGRQGPPTAYGAEAGELRVLLDGLPVGGVATMRLERGAVVELTGPLYLTMRITALLQ